MTIDLDHLRTWIGRSAESSEMLTPGLVRRFNATFDRTSPLDTGAEAPLLIHLCLGQSTTPTAGLAADGHATRGDFMPPVPLPRRMWAGGAFDFQSAPLIGETVTRTSEILDVFAKEGRSGLLCFVAVEHRITAGGRMVLTERQDLVYREAVSAPAAEPPTPAAAPQGESTRVIAADAPYLFRYSALTFNSHRIHYDVDYARDVEGYPGLVVHGPLQATLLVQYAADLAGKPPSRFAFRSMAPIFDTAAFTINAKPEGTSMHLWTAQADGPVAMEARADW